MFGTDASAFDKSELGSGDGEVGGAAGLDSRVKAGLTSVPHPLDDSAEDTTW